jgi:serine phosphatase RsbU (regulator of sigma subunit)
MRRPAVRDPRALAALIAGIGVVLTCLASWTLARVDANSEHRLLQEQTKQAASVLSTAVSLVEQPLATALSVQRVAGAANRVAFGQFMAPYVGDGKPFVSASLWRREGDDVRQVTTTGAAPVLAPDGPQMRSFLLGAFDAQDTTARLVTGGDRSLLAWARADRGTGFAVYAERPLPADRRASVARDSAYAGLHYAIYLDHHTDAGSLLTTDVPLDSLPMRDDAASATIQLGDTDLTLVTTARTHLGSTLSRWLPLGVLIGGLALTGIAALTGLRLARRQRDAERGEATITALYEQVEELYGRQHELFQRLQRALLPPGDLTFPELEVAAQYVSGAQGTEIGGDWYSLVPLDEHRFAFVVGDVSGRGIDTVAVMAKARFTVRAYLLDGHEPAVALEKCSRQFDIVEDGHMTTVVAGVGDIRTGEVRIASAGHPPPVLLDGGARTVDVRPGRPLGTGPSRYAQTSFCLEPGATLFCFTDGLVERRGESIDAGLARLVSTLSDAVARPVGDLVAHAVGSLRSQTAGDDIAALALRRVGAR